MRAWKVSLSGSRRAVATAICLSVRWYCIVNVLQTSSTTIEVVAEGVT